MAVRRAENTRHVPKDPLEDCGRKYMHNKIFNKQGRETHAMMRPESLSMWPPVDQVAGFLEI